MVSFHITYVRTLIQENSLLSLAYTTYSFSYNILHTLSQRPLPWARHGEQRRPEGTIVDG